MGGGELIFVVSAEPPSYDGHKETTFAMLHPTAPHYSLLVKFDQAQNFEKITGDLAESWTVSPDGMTYTFKIRSGVKFHDGSPLTSADIKATYDRIIDPPPGVVSIRKAYYADLLVEAPDPTTVVFKLKNPMAGVLEALASPFNCVYSAAKLKENPRYPETEIMGSGPFTFVAHVKGSSWEGKRFDGYFQKGLPYLDGYKIFYVKSGGVAEAPGTELYMLADQLPKASGFGPANMNFVVRSTMPLSSLANEYRRAVQELDPTLPLIRMRSMDAVIGDAIARPRFLTVLLGIFAGLALVLAAVGTYGILAYLVTERKQEIGIRMALGADRGKVLRLVLGRGLLLSGIGLVIGLAASLGLTRVMATLLFNVTPTDPFTLASVAAVIALVAAAACIIPAWRATRVDPLTVLRDN